MKCPKGHRLSITHTKNVGDVVQRRRHCPLCNYEVSTDERIVERPPSPHNRGCLWPMPPAQALSFAIYAIDATMPNGNGQDEEEWTRENKKALRALRAMRAEIEPKDDTG